MTLLIKRLFIFAGFDTKNYIRGTNDTAVIDESMIAYVRALSEIGDVVVYIDNDMSADELRKLKPYTLYAGANAHGEYDFGSYKRTYIWARENLKLSGYDWVYFANDSMYAPVRPIGPALENLESRGTDAIGIIYNAHKKKPHIQSWFFGMRKKIFTSKKFDTFITNISKQTDKGAVTYLYEQGFTRMLNSNKWTFGYMCAVTGHAVYNHVKKLFKRGIPFVKKAAFGRHNGALGRQLLYILNHIDPEMRRIIISDAKRVYGDKYIDNLLTNNIIKIMYRNITYSLHKIFTGGL